MRFVVISDTHIGGRFDEMVFYEGVKIVNSLKCDYLIHCGDLTNDGTLAQYEVAKLYLETITKKPFLIVPGNHDTENVGDLLWEEMIGPRYFVHEDKKNQVKILGLDSTEPDSNTGRMGPKAIKRIYEEFGDLPEYWLKVLVFHHQTLPIPYTGRERSAINDAGDAVKAILECNIHIVINGHRHISNVYKMSDGALQAWIINCGTLSCKKTRYREGYSMTVIDANRAKNNLIIRSIILKHDSTEEKLSFNSKFQEVIPPMVKEPYACLVQIGNTDVSAGMFNTKIFDKAVNAINSLETDLVVHCGGVTASSHLYEFELAKELLDTIDHKKLIVPGVKDAYPLGCELFPEYIGEKNPSFVDDKLHILGYNSCIIDEKEGRLGRGNTREIVEKLAINSKIGVVVFNHTIVPLPKTKHDSELMDAGDVLATLVNNRINLVLTGAKNKSGCWQVGDTVFANVGTLSSYNLATRAGNSFNIINIFKTDIGHYYEIDEYLLEENKKRNIGNFHVSDIVEPIQAPMKLKYEV